MPRKKDDIITGSITDALFILLKNKNVKNISITELIKKAGVSRNSFYRNFKSIEDIAYQYFIKETYVWWEEKVVKENMESLSMIAKSMIEYFYTIRERILLAYEGGLSSAFIRHVFDCACARRKMEDKKQSYMVARVSGLICGVMEEWIKGKMSDSPEYVAAFLDTKNIYIPN